MTWNPCVCPLPHVAYAVQAAVAAGEVGEDEAGEGEAGGPQAKGKWPNWTITLCDLCARAEHYTS